MLSPGCALLSYFILPMPFEMDSTASSILEVRPMLRLYPAGHLQEAESGFASVTFDSELVFSCHNASLSGT